MMAMVVMVAMTVMTVIMVMIVIMIMIVIMVRPLGAAEREIVPPAGRRVGSKAARCGNVP